MTATGTEIKTAEITETTAAPAAAGKTKKGMPAALKVILSILICVLFLIVCLAGTAIIILRASCTKEHIESFVDRVDYLTLLIPDECGTDVSLSELLSASTVTNNESVNGKADAAKMIEATKAKDALSEYLYSYASFILYGTDLNELDKRAVKKFYDSKTDGIEKGLGFRLTESDKENFYAMLDENKKAFDALSEESIMDDLGTPVKLVRFSVSWIGIAAAAVLGVMSAVLLVLLLRSPSKMLILTGSIMTAAGAAGLLLIILAANGVIGVDISAVTAAATLYKAAFAVFAPITVSIVSCVIMMGLMLLITGIFVSVFVKRIKADKNM